MNSRERFLEVMNFNTDVRTLKWEFGFWGENMNQWYEEGLPYKTGTNIPTRITTTHASLYTTVWTYAWKKTRTYLEKYYGEREQRIILPQGIAIWGGGLYWPSQGFPLASDVMDYFGFDKTTSQVPVEQMFYPLFDPQILGEDEAYVDYIDIDGVKRRFQKVEAVIPTALDWPIKDWDSWNEIKATRLRMDEVCKRFPANWGEWVEEYKRRDYPLALGGYPIGLFGTLVHLMGYENIFLKYYDAPDLVHDVLNHFTTLWLAIWEEILADVEVDCIHIWEDMSSTKGPLISKKVFNTFMAPHYRRITDFAKAHEINTVLVDTDGNCEPLIPQLIDVGVTGCYPMETSAGMDVVKIRKEYPKFQMMGGVPKYDMALGPKRIDEFLEPVGALLDYGGYVPFGDHCISPGVSWEQFKYYRQRLNELIDSKGKY